MAIELGNPEDEIEEFYSDSSASDTDGDDEDDEKAARSLRSDEANPLASGAPYPPVAHKGLPLDLPVLEEPDEEAGSSDVPEVYESGMQPDEYQGDGEEDPVGDEEADGEQDEAGDDDEDDEQHLVSFSDLSRALFSVMGDELQPGALGVFASPGAQPDAESAPNEDPTMDEEESGTRRSQDDHSDASAPSLGLGRPSEGGSETEHSLEAANQDPTNESPVLEQVDEDPELMSLDLLLKQARRSLLTEFTDGNQDEAPEWSQTLQALESGDDGDDDAAAGTTSPTADFDDDVEDDQEPAEGQHDDAAAPAAGAAAPDAPAAAQDPEQEPGLGQQAEQAEAEQGAPCHSPDRGLPPKPTSSPLPLPQKPDDPTPAPSFLPPRPAEPFVAGRPEPGHEPNNPPATPGSLPPRPRAPPPAGMAGALPGSALPPKPPPSYPYPR